MYCNTIIFIVFSDEHQNVDNIGTRVSNETYISQIEI